MDIIVTTDYERQVRMKELENQDDLLKEQTELQKNDSFIQLNMVALNEMTELSPSALKLYMALCKITFNEKYVNLTEGAFCIVSLNYLINEIKLGKATIINATKELVKMEWIKVFKTGNANVYAINPNKSWRSTANTKWKALYNDTNIKGLAIRTTTILDGIQTIE